MHKLHNMLHTPRIVFATLLLISMTSTLQATIFADSFELPPGALQLSPPLSQQPSARLTFMNQQMNWYLDKPYNDLNTWMYDRVQALYELYLRTKDEKIHAEAIKSADEYVKRYTNTGTEPDFADCNPGWSLPSDGVNKCDTKFTYASACWYRFKVDGVDLCDQDLLERLRRYFMSSGWNAAGFLDKIPNTATFVTTERNMGHQLMGMVYIYKIAKAKGLSALETQAQSDIKAVIKWLYDWQKMDPYGAWMHSYNGHEGSDNDPGVNDWLIFSPWQSAILTGGLWRAWSAGFTTDTCGKSNEPCIPAMLVSFAQAMEDYGWVKNPTKLNPPYGWMHGENESGQIPWYIAYPTDSQAQINKQDADGWFADEHDPELQCVAALGYYFSKDATQKTAFRTRYEALEGYYVPSLAARDDPARMFAWQHSHNPSCEWLMENG